MHRLETNGIEDMKGMPQDDLLGSRKSWDTESRYRLQEAGLALADSARRTRALGEDTGDALFRVQVELGLHELTAALSSLRWAVIASLLML